MQFEYENNLHKVEGQLDILIISMTKLLDADWLRGVQLFH